MSKDNRNEGKASNVVQSGKHEGDVNAPVITGDGVDVIEGIVTMEPNFIMENATPLEDLFTIDFNVKGDDGDEYWCASHIRWEGVAAPPEDLSEGDRVRVTGVSFGGCGTPGEPVEFHAKTVEKVG